MSRIQPSFYLLEILFSSSWGKLKMKQENVLTKKKLSINFIVDWMSSWKYIHEYFCNDAQHNFKFNNCKQNSNQCINCLKMHMHDQKSGHICSSRMFMHIARNE